MACMEFKVIIDMAASWMRRLLLIIFLLMLIVPVKAQEVITAVSESGYVSITKDPPKPPYLIIDESSIQFEDMDDNQKINANESVSISFLLINTGYGPGLNLKVSVIETNNVPKLEFEKFINIGKLEVNESKYIQIPLTAGMDLPDGKAVFKIKIEEINGFDSEDVQIELETKAFEPPDVKVVDYKVISEASSILEKRKPFDLQVLIQNVGNGTAHNISIKTPVPQSVFCLSANNYILLESLEPGEQYLAEYTFVTNTEYSAATIPIYIELTEKYQKYAENRNIQLEMNQNVSNTRLVVEGKKEEKYSFAIGYLTSAVDRNIPISKKKFPNRIALIIGNENYSGSINSEIDVEFARNDADIFKKYCLNVLGVEERNLFYLLDATAGEMRREIDRVAKLLKKLGESGEMIFYYAGHGFPDENTKTPYLIPVDVDATNLSAAIKLSEIYNKFGSADASKVTVFLDACFTGGGRNQGLLAARGVKIKPDEEQLSGNMVVFSATSEKQSALPYRKEQHGMFTYFLLKKLQSSNGDISYGELASYLKDMVGVESLRENGKSQDPEVITSYSVAEEWEEWEMK